MELIEFGSGKLTRNEFASIDQSRMMHDDLPAVLKQFIEQHIESVPQLEALLLLRSGRQREWTAAEIAKELYIPEKVAIPLLADFTKQGFAALAPHQSAVYCYQSRDQETDQLIEALDALYRERRVAIISLIYSKPLNKVQTLADAFRFGKENPS